MINQGVISFNRVIKYSLFNFKFRLPYYLSATMFLFVTLMFAACDSSDVDELEEIIDGIERKPIDVKLVGANAFGNLPEFGSACEQYKDIQNNLGLKYLRLLINWNDAVQPSPSAGINFSFYDTLVNCIQDRQDAILVVNGLPSWMNNSNNWIAGDPRKTFVQLWFSKVVRRYGNIPRVIGFEAWNEPNRNQDPENVLLGLDSNPENYVELLALASAEKNSLGVRKLIIGAATSSIVQDFPAALNYNEAMREAGAEEFLDIWGVHYYGTQFENFVISGGVADFLNKLTVPIWVTESGEIGSDKQLAYVETVWPYVKEKVPNIERFYYYQYADNAPVNSNYGLRYGSSSTSVSDLYRYLSSEHAG